MKLTLLAGHGSSTNILRNYLHDHGFDDVEAIIEGRVSRRAMISHRRRRLGSLPVLGQIAFMTMAQPLLRRSARARRAQILLRHGLREDVPSGAEIRVQTINDPIVSEHLRRRRPDAVIVNGTRIIREHILAASDCPFINIHAGITPQYRGVHGGYWALWSGDPANFGATIHLVDAGVDTGMVLRHVRPAVHPDDNFSTYPLVQQAAALPELVALLEEIAGGGPRASPGDPGAESRQWYHPTLPQYLAGRVRGVR